MTEPTPPTAEPTPPTAEPSAPPAPATAWTAPEPTPGPAPGVEFAEPGARLVAYIIDVLIIAGVTVLLSIIGVVFLVILPIISMFFWIAAVLFGLVYFPISRRRTARRSATARCGPRRPGRGRRTGIEGSAMLRLVGYWVSAPSSTSGTSGSSSTSGATVGWT